MNEYTVTLTRTVEITITVKATNEDHAHERAENLAGWLDLDITQSQNHLVDFDLDDDGAWDVQCVEEN